MNEPKEISFEVYGISGGGTSIEDIFIPDDLKGQEEEIKVLIDILVELGSSIDLHGASDGDYDTAIRKILKKYE